MLKFAKRIFSVTIVLALAVQVLLPVTTLASSKTITVDSTQIKSHVNRVWYGRVHKILEFRFFDMSDCSGVSLQNTLKQFGNLSLDSSDPIALENILDLYQRSHSPQIEPICQRQLDKNENLFWKHEAKAFRISKMLFPLSKVLKDLNPHCISRQVPSLNGKYDSNPCLAADEMIGRSLMSDLELWLSQMAQLNTAIRARFSEKIQNKSAAESVSTDESEFLKTDAGADVDLYAIFLSATSTTDTPENRERALSILAGALASAPSWSAYFDGITDIVWREQIKNSESALSKRQISNLVRIIPELRLQIDELSQLFKWGRSNVEGMSWRGIELRQGNHHNIMSAYLACHYRERTALTHEFLPKLMGDIYEAKDFVSHITIDKSSFASAAQNFETDTKRYADGVKWGFRFCKMMF